MAKKTDNSNIGANLLWMHKFKKLYRTISVNGGFNHTESQGTALLYSNIDFYRNGVIDSTRTLDQNTITDNVLNSINTRIAYTEPLVKDFYLELSYAFGLTRNANNRNIFSNDGAGNYNQFIDSLSNDFQFNSLSNAPELISGIIKRNSTSLWELQLLSPAWISAILRKEPRVVTILLIIRPGLT